MSVSQGFGLELGDDGVGLEVGSDRVGDELEGRVLAHPAWHLFGGGEEGIELLAEFSRLKREIEETRTFVSQPSHRTRSKSKSAPYLNSRPAHLSDISDLSPDAGKSRPDSLEIVELFDDGREAIVAS
jgi:hypothetical protein